MKTDAKRSSDISEISPKLIKLSAEFIKRHLSLVFNESFKEDIVPEKLKPTTVHPMHKGNSSMTRANYRTVSVLPMPSKFIEKMAHKRLINHLVKYELLFKHQYDFQTGKSTGHAILNLYRNLDRK